MIKIVTPIEANSLTATTNPQEVYFSSPLKSLSIVNSGPSGLKFWIENSNQHILNSGEGLDLDSEYGINSVYVESLGTSNVRFVGVKKHIQKEKIKTVSSLENSPVPIPVIKANDFNLNFGLIVLAIIAVVGIVAIAVACRK